MNQEEEYTLNDDKTTTITAANVDWMPLSLWTLFSNCVRGGRREHKKINFWFQKCYQKIELF